MNWIIHSVNQDSLVNVVKILSGEIPINTNNGSIKIVFQLDLLGFNNREEIWNTFKSILN